MPTYDEAQISKENELRYLEEMELVRQISLRDIIERNAGSLPHGEFLIDSGASSSVMRLPDTGAGIWQDTQKQRSEDLERMRRELGEATLQVQQANENLLRMKQAYEQHERMDDSSPGGFAQARSLRENALAQKGLEELQEFMEFAKEDEWKSSLLVIECGLSDKRNLLDLLKHRILSYHKVHAI